jgi:AcrR family transcriptional regulator
LTFPAIAGKLVFTRLVIANMSERAVSKSRLSAQERRAAILDAAVKLFAERGFRGTTTRELASAVGVTEPVLYEHFRTKRDLYTAIIDAKSQQGVGVLSELARRYEDQQDDRGFFTALAQLILRWHRTDTAFVRLLLFSALEGHELKDLFYERQSCAGIEVVAGYLRRRIETGAFRNIDPRLAGLAFMGMVAHYSINRLLFQTGDANGEPDEVVATMVDIFLHGLASQPQSEAK